METALEWILTNALKADMIAYLAAHPEDFEEAINLAIADKQPYSWRAAWLLWSCMEANDWRIRRFVKPIVEAIPDRNDNQQRELFIILQLMELEEAVEGQLFNHCISVWAKIGKKPSVRYNAFKLIVKMAKKHPDLSREILLLTHEQYLDPFSPTAQKSILGMVKGFR